jgi:hypothetical protein
VWVNPALVLLATSGVGFPGLPSPKSSTLILWLHPALNLLATFGARFLGLPSVAPPALPESVIPFAMSLDAGPRSAILTLDGLPRSAIFVRDLRICHSGLLTLPKL